MKKLLLAVFSIATTFSLYAQREVPQERMEQIYEEVKTPYKYGLAVAPADNYHKILYINILFNYGLKLTLDKELLKDCIHDVFVKLYTKKDELGTIDNLKSYMFISLKNKLCDELRKRMYMSDTAIEEVNMLAPTDVENDYAEKEQRKNEFFLIKRLLNQLSPRQREALTLYYIEEKKYEDICEIMNMNYQSVRNLMYRGLTKLRDLAS